MEGKTIVFTGTLEVKRTDATKMAVEAGATVASSVTGKTHILVAGADAGSKIAAAQSKGVSIWSEAQFMAALSNTGKIGKRKASEDTAPVAKRPALANKKPAPEAKSPAPGSAQPLAGMTFVRTGRFEYQKAVGDFVRSLGGTWVKTANQATATVDGTWKGEVLRSWNKVAHFQVLEQGKPVVPVSNCFRDTAESPAAVQEFLQALQTARQVVDTHVKAGATPADLIKAYREAFPAFYDGGPDANLPCHGVYAVHLTQQGNKGLKWTTRA